MQPCATVGCGRWIAYGEYCAKHAPTPTPASKPAKPQGFKHPTREDRAGLPAIDATEVRVTQRPRVSRVKPWSHVRGGTLALSDCTVTKPDGTRYTIPKNRRNRDVAEHRPVRREIDAHEATRVKLLGIAAQANKHDYTEQ